MVEIEDIRQCCHEWFLTHPVKLDEWEAIGPRDAKNLIYKSLRNASLDYCQRWKARTLGYEVDDLFYYTPEMIETLLPAVYLGIDKAPMPNISLTKTSKPSVQAEGGNLATMLADVNSAQSKLSTEDRSVLYMRFGLGLEFSEIAKEFELLNADTARGRLRRAISRLIMKLGGRRPYQDDDSVMVIV